MSAQVWRYLTAFGIAGVLSLVLTPVAKSIAGRRGILDIPADHKSHVTPTPYLGGVAMLAGLGLGLLLALLFDIEKTIVAEFRAVVVITILLSLMGLVDDLVSLPFLPRLVFEVFVAAVMWAADVRVSLFGNDSINALVTIVWFVGIINAFNLLDNMDGLSAGTAAVASASFFFIAALNDQYLVATLALAICGSTIGFLFHNFHPATIYMGDSGSLMLGYLVAYLGLKLQVSAGHGFTFLVPLAIASTAILDTSVVTFCRLRNGRSPFRGGRDHLSHRLVSLGLSIPAAVGVIYFLSIFGGVVGFLVSRVDRLSALVVGLFYLASLLTVGVLLGGVRVYED